MRVFSFGDGLPCALEPGIREMVKIVRGIRAVRADEVVEEGVGLLSVQEFEEAVAPVGNQGKVVILDKANVAERAAGHPPGDFARRPRVALLFDRMADGAKVRVGNKNGVRKIELVKVGFGSTVDEQEAGGIKPGV